MKTKTPIEQFAAWSEKRAIRVNVEMQVKILHEFATWCKIHAISARWTKLDDRDIANYLRRKKMHGCSDLEIKFAYNAIRTMQTYASYRRRK